MKKLILVILAGFSVLAGAQSPSTAQQSIANLLPNGGFENGRAKWSTFQTTLAAAPGLNPTTAPATCASCSITIAATTAGALSGKTSLLVSSTGATTPGQGFISAAFPISPSAALTVLTQRANYSVTTNVQNVNLTGTTANSWATYIYELPSGTWTQPTGVYGMTVVAGATTPVTFQPLSTTTSIRVAVVAVNATAGAHAILWDDFNVGVQSQSAGVAATDEVSLVSPITGLGGTNPVKPTMIVDRTTWSRVGDKMHIHYTATFPASGGTTVNACYQIAIPNGYVADMNKVSSYANLAGTANAGNGASAIGPGSFWDQVNNAVGYAYLQTPTQIIVRGKSGPTANLNATAVGDQCWGGNGFYSFGNSNGPSTVAFDAWIPIVGWSTNVGQSSDYDGRSLTFNGTQTSAVNSLINLPMTPLIDRAGAWNPTLSVYVVQAAGDYLANAGTISSGTGAAMNFYLNGANYNRSLMNYISATATATGGTMLYTGLKIGDQISVVGAGGGSFSAGWLAVSYVGGKQLIQQAPAVVASYGLTASQTGAAGAAIKFDTKVTDSTNMCSAMATTGLCTINIPGTYEMTLQSWVTANGGITPYLSINGGNNGYFATAVTGNVQGGAPIIATLLQGATVGFFSDAGTPTYQGSQGRGIGNRFVIKRIGN